MRANIIVATHHKTGTSWMASVFQGIARDLDVKFFVFRESHAHLDDPAAAPAIFFNDHSAFGERIALLDRPDIRIIHLVRDPRDAIVSAMHYHTHSNEPWLHKPYPRFDGQTYQEKLNSFDSYFDRCLFEMDNSAKHTINDMLAWRYDRSNCFEVRYEDLIGDVEMVLWNRIVEFLGFEADEIEVCRKNFWHFSLFGGMADVKHPHLRNGKAAQWKDAFGRDLGNEFVRRFPDALQKLGYEDNHDWLDRLPETPRNCD